MAMASWFRDFMCSTRLVAGSNQATGEIAKFNNKLTTCLEWNY